MHPSHAQAWSHEGIERLRYDGPAEFDKHALQHAEVRAAHYVGMSRRDFPKRAVPQHQRCRRPLGRRLRLEADVFEHLMESIDRTARPERFLVRGTLDDLPAPR